MVVLAVMVVMEVTVAVAGVVALASWLVAKIRRHLRSKPVRASDTPVSPTSPTQSKVQATLLQKAGERLGEVCGAVAKGALRLSIAASEKILNFVGRLRESIEEKVLPVLFRALAKLLDVVVIALRDLFGSDDVSEFRELGRLPQVNELDWRKP